MHRRNFLKTAGATLAFAGYPVHGFTQNAIDGRVVVIILEGGMDGLTAIPPIGDRDLFRQRKGLTASNPLEINPFFAVHPSLKNFSGMLARNEAAIAHATSMPYTNRSHFEGQNVIEAGYVEPFSSSTGWLGRAMDEAKIAGRAMALDTPLLIRGMTGIDNFYPASIDGSHKPDTSIIEILANAHDGFEAETFATLKKAVIKNADLPRVRDPEGLALAAGRAMRLPDGPRVAVIRIPEFDTHSNQGAADGMHADLLGVVDRTLDTLRVELKETWQNTIAITATEFGRTVQENGSLGTDHGYGSVALMAGGLIKRSSVLANWPGLANKDLFEQRDLMVTLDYRAVAAACVEAAFGLDHDVVAEKIFGEKSLDVVHPLIFG
jgi:uncharacterized protein (DUF1501 family)